MPLILYINVYINIYTRSKAYLVFRTSITYKCMNTIAFVWVKSEALQDYIDTATATTALHTGYTPVQPSRGGRGGVRHLDTVTTE